MERGMADRVTGYVMLGAATVAVLVGVRRIVELIEPSGEWLPVTVVGVCTVVAVLSIRAAWSSVRDRRPSSLASWTIGASALITAVMLALATAALPAVGWAAVPFLLSCGGGFVCGAVVGRERGRTA